MQHARVELVLSIGVVQSALLHSSLRPAGAAASNSMTGVAIVGPCYPTPSTVRSLSKNMSQFKERERSGQQQPSHNNTTPLHTPAMIDGTGTAVQGSCGGSNEDSVSLHKITVSSFMLAQAWAQVPAQNNSAGMTVCLTRHAVRQLHGWASIRV